MRTLLRRCGSLLSIIACLLVTAVHTVAADTRPIQITPDSKTYSSTLTNADVGVKSVTFWFQATGNVSEAIDLYVEGPVNGKVQLQSFFMPSTATVESLLAKPESGNILPLLTSTGAEKKSYTFVATAGALSEGPTTAAAGSFNCKTMSAEALAAVIKLYRDMYHSNVTAADLCLPGTAPGGDVAPTATPTSGSGIPPYIKANTFRAVLSKDTCRAARTSKYLVGVNFDLTGVDASLYSSGIRLVVALQKRPFTGSKASSIKPVSEGQYAPRPLVMMSTVGGYYSGGEKILVKKWARNKVRSTKTLKVVKYVFYNGMMLSTALVQPVLTGGKGTFELTSGANVYSVCFALTRTRQRANGYRN